VPGEDHDAVDERPEHADADERQQKLRDRDPRVAAVEPPDPERQQQLQHPGHHLVPVGIGQPGSGVVAVRRGEVARETGDGRGDGGRCRQHGGGLLVVGEILEERHEIIAGTGGVRGGRALLVLLVVEPALRVVLPEGAHGRFPLRIADAYGTGAGRAHVRDGTGGWCLCARTRAA